MRRRLKAAASIGGHDDPGQFHRRSAVHECYAVWKSPIFEHGGKRFRTLQRRLLEDFGGYAEISTSRCRARLNDLRCNRHLSDVEKGEEQKIAH